MKKKKAFTLIELLVVIAIIALLLSILGPSLRYAREQGRTVVCAAHARGLGYAVFAYLDSNDNAFADAANNGLWEDPDTGEELPYNHSYAYWGIAYSYYADTKEVFHCPSSVTADFWMLPWEPFNGWPIKELEEMFYYCHYGLNGYLPSYSDPVRITEFKIPSNVIFAQDHIEQLLDGINSDMFCKGPSASVNLSQWRGYQASYRDIYPAAVSECFRHNRASYGRKSMTDAYAVEKGVANNLWLDGHVSRIDESKGEDVFCRWYTGKSEQ